MEEENPMEKRRRHYSPEQKVAILREHLIEQLPVSELCEKHQIHPTLFYHWNTIVGTKPSKLIAYAQAARCRSKMHGAW